ncbi:MAG: DUF6188 family protein [Planctomycetota bacterium]
MYKWPVGLSPNEFCGLVVEAITFSINTITINFGQDYGVTVESSIRMKIKDAEEEVSIPPTSTRLMSLVGKTVQVSTVDADGASLLLQFGEGCQVRLEGGDKEYECFHINAKGKEFVI